MNRDTVSAVYEQARAAVEGVGEEAYRLVAFEVIFRRLLEGAGHMPVHVPAATVGGEQSRQRTTAPDVSISEFLARLRVKSYPDRVVAIAYYRLREGQDDVTRSEFLDALSRARIPKPKNLSDVIAQAIRKGHLMDADLKDGQKAWKITITGERYVEEKTSALEP